MVAKSRGRHIHRPGAKKSVKKGFKKRYGKKKGEMSTARWKAN